MPAGENRLLFFCFILLRKEGGCQWRDANAAG